jgi:hypothetical protein
MEILLVMQPITACTGIAVGKEIGPLRAIINQRNVEQIINERCIIYRAKPPDCVRIAAASAFDVSQRAGMPRDDFIGLGDQRRLCKLCKGLALNGRLEKWTSAARLISLLSGRSFPVLRNLFPVSFHREYR